MTIYQAIALLAAGVGGGIAGTMASVASVVSYPALLALGLPPLAANVTNTVSLVLLVPGAVAGSRPELAGQRSRVLRIGAVMAAGGAVGAVILLLAPPGAFALVVPVLIVFAAVLIVVQPRLAALAPRPGAEHSRWRLAALFGVAVYQGYFGAAGGVLVLAVLAATLTESLIRVNAIKNVVSGAANLVAATIFALDAPVDWAFVPLLSAGFLIGGYAGPRLVRYLPVSVLRMVVAYASRLIGIGMAMGMTRTFKGTWALDHKGHLCRTFVGDLPSEMPSNPVCTDIAPHKIGDKWTLIVKGMPREVTLVQGIH